MFHIPPITKSTAIPTNNNHITRIITLVSIKHNGVLTVSAKAASRDTDGSDLYYNRAIGVINRANRDGLIAL
jgi:hypothetical protein